MTTQEASAIAQDYIAHQNQENPVYPGYAYALVAPKEYFDCWYFDFHIVSLLEVPEDEQEMFAGAPGLTVSKTDKSVSIIGWQKFHQLAQREKLFQEASGIANELLSSNLTLQALRKHFAMPLAELALFKRRLEAPDLANQQKKSLLVAQFMRETEPF